MMGFFKQLQQLVQLVTARPWYGSPQIWLAFGMKSQPSTTRTQWPSGVVSVVSGFFMVEPLQEIHREKIEGVRAGDRVADPISIQDPCVYF